MNREDPWGDAVNGRPAPNPMPGADDRAKPEPRLPDPGQREYGKPDNKEDDPTWNKAGAVTMAACTIAIVLTICLLVLHVFNVAGF